MDIQGGDGEGGGLMPGVKTYKPRLRVLLIKGVIDPDNKRVLEKYKPGSMIDLTPLIGDGGHVSTNKSIYKPVGAFEIGIPDKPLVIDGYPAGIDSLWGVIEPMDQVIIGMARNVGAYGSQFKSWIKGQIGAMWGDEGIPMVMTGFVRKVVRDESMDQSGKPRRRILIYGNDYGCIGEIAQVSRIAGISRDINMLPLSTLDQLGLKTGKMKAAEFVEAIRKNMFVKQIEFMRAKMPGIFDIKRSAPVVLDGVEHGIVTKGTVITNALGDFDGTAWTILHKFSDSPWNELFLEDRCNMDTGEFGPYLVFRPTPFRSYKSDSNQDSLLSFWNNGIVDNMEQKLYADVIVDSSEKPLIGAYQQRSDAAVSNVYWVPLWQGSLWSDRMLANALENKDSLTTSFDKPRSSLDIYGPRIINHDSKLVADDVTLTIQTQAVDAEKAIITNTEWAKKRQSWLRDANEDNVGFSDGVLRVQGQERLRAGCYYMYSRGQMLYTQYVTGVSHLFVPYQGFTTTMQYIRGDNFYKRIAQQKPPHLLEGHVGAYS